MFNRFSKFLFIIIIFLLIFFISSCSYKVNNLNKQGYSLFNEGNYEEAIKCFDQALQINPKSIKAWKGKGTILKNQKKYKKAIECFNKLVEIDPNNAEAWNDKGLSLNEIENYEEAIQCFKKGVNIAPNNPFAWCGEGLALYEQQKLGEGNYEEAIQCFDKALKIDPNNANAWCGKGLALYEQGFILAENKNYEEAIQCFDKTLKIDPNNANAWCGKGLALYKHIQIVVDEQKNNEARKCFEKALEIDPNNANAWYGKSFNERDFKKKVEYCEKTLAIDQKCLDAWQCKISFHRITGKFTIIYSDEALESTDKLLTVYPNCMYFWYFKAKIFFFGIPSKYNTSAERDNEFIKCLDKVLSINPKFIPALFDKANFLNNKTLKKNEAVKCLDKILSINPNCIEGWKSKAFFLEQQTKYDEAIKCYDKALEINSNDTDSWNSKAEILKDQGKKDEAIKCYNKILEIEPNSAFTDYVKRQIAELTKRVLPDYPEMIFIQGGTFMIGSNKGNSSEQPVHPVTISNFYMGKYEITNQQYCIFLNSDNNNLYTVDTSKEDCGITQTNGEFIVKPDCENLPVVYVSYYGADAYCLWLSKATGKNYHLPTEAQWEYACRAGSTSEYYWGDQIDGNYCWYSGNSNSINHEVGLKSPNNFGLYDMSGNVWEWCGDYLGESYVPFEQVDPVGAFVGGCALRGGGVVGNTSDCRSACRGIVPSDYRKNQYPHSGFRVVMY